MRNLLVLFLAASLIPPASSFACGIEGKGIRSGGAKVDGTARVSTSWNKNTAYPRDGYYNLELGKSACGENVEVFVNGYSIGRRSLPRDGNARVDFVLKGSGNVPVR